MIEAISPVPRTTEITIEIAKTRTPSANARTTRKVAPVKRRMRLPNRHPHQFVGGVHFTAEILRQEERRNNDTGEEISQDHLKESQIPGESQRGRADDCQRAGFGRDDGKRNGPPRGGSPAEEKSFRLF